MIFIFLDLEDLRIRQSSPDFDILSACSSCQYCHLRSMLALYEYYI